MEQNREYKNRPKTKILGWFFTNRQKQFSEGKGIVSLQQLVLVHRPKNELWAVSYIIQKKKPQNETFLVVRWIRIWLPMQGTQVPSRKIPYAMEQLSPGTTSTEPVSSRATSTEPECRNDWNPCAAATEAAVTETWTPRACAPQEKLMHHSKELPPLTATRESPQAPMKTQCNRKYK